ncbi:SIR2 family NAD-dependent protein deacylase [Thermomonospora amylolytica]|uniref:SIR2 family NAD-dependent protein deacylase n=1 Tax=Thermomonospora amylolytica TaxID=1411117 RepID=UPI000E6B68BD|nr:Sir2 family NAD-dependent protein deacetylase [Thermomonospora amylolytica]
MDGNSPAWVRGVSRVAVLTGAGISTDSGIPDYRGPSGVWTRDPELAEIFNRERFVADPGVRRRYWRHIGGLYRADVRPNAAHRALAELEASGTAVRILTQNVDGLHQRAGSSPRKVLELHGTLATARCLRCGATEPTPQVLERVAAGADDPPCLKCGGTLQPAVVMFGQFLDSQVLSLAQNIARHSQLFLAVGTSLTVEPSAGLCAAAVECGATLVIVNRDPTPYDELATEIVREPIGTALPRICAALRSAAA